MSTGTDGRSIRTVDDAFFAALLIDFLLGPGVGVVVRNWSRLVGEVARVFSYCLGVSVAFVGVFACDALLGAFSD